MRTAIHDHVHHQGSSLQSAAKLVFEAGGEQWTDLRAAVFEVLVATGHPSSAYDIAAAVGEKLNRRIVPNSIYRILDLFVSQNLALRVESRNAYIANPHPGCVHDCIFLICDDCGGTDHMDNDPIVMGVRGAASQAGFRVKRPVIEVRGTCHNCTEREQVGVPAAGVETAQ
jgi:Fur family zinc uptake transcriptional regulator